MRRACIIVTLIAGIAIAASPALAAEEVKPPRIQIAVLLDTSGSMEGLIEQAKAHLWKVVNEFALAKKDGKIPHLEVALYEYGKSTIPAAEQYIRMIVPLTTDLDKVSEELFALRTNGGDEYCGAVIKAATEGLEWSPANGDLKAIFIAGNEPFTQGQVNFRGACKAAVTKGIVVSTIFCGPHQTGIDTHWRDGAVLADGTYMNIDQNRAIAHITAPQDKEIARLSAELNTTYLGYGHAGRQAAARQVEQDAEAEKLSVSVLAQRAAFKSSVQYRSSSWDLVDAVKEGKVDLSKAKPAELPENMRKMTPEQRKVHVAGKAKERARIQEAITKLHGERKQYVAEQRKKLGGSQANSLDTVLIESLRQQAARKHFTLK